MNSVFPPTKWQKKVVHNLFRNLNESHAELQQLNVMESTQSNARFGNSQAIESNLSSPARTFNISDHSFTIIQLPDLIKS